MALAQLLFKERSTVKQFMTAYQKNGDIPCQHENGTMSSVSLSKTSALKKNTPITAKHIKWRPPSIRENTTFF